jgi:predicted regulator of amino acid metabolism with ACT domain
MTTNKIKHFKYLIKNGYSFNNVTAFFMSEAGISMTDIALKAGVSRQMVRMVIYQERRSALVEQALSQGLGFNPWGVE